MDILYCVVCNKDLFHTQFIRMYDNSFCSEICVGHILHQYNQVYKQHVMTGQYYCTIGRCVINVTLFRGNKS
jgi:hypothetical protein